MATATKSKSEATAKRPAASQQKGSKSASADSKTTVSHKTIQAWAEKRKGKPSVVKSTAEKGDEGGILRIDFPGYSGKDSLEEITWEQFFEIFDSRGLAFLYQEKTAGGRESHFNKFVSRAGNK